MKLRYLKERWYQRESNKQVGVFDEECKDLSRKFWVLMNEFDKLNALFYEWQALEREEQRHWKHERWKIRAATFI